MKKILIADANKASLVMTSEVFKDHYSGIQVLVARTSQEAIDIAKANKNIDAYIVDFDLPDQNGAQTAAALKKLSSKPVLITAFENNATEQLIDNLLAKYNDCKSWLKKPISPDVTIAVAQRYCEGKIRLQKRLQCKIPAIAQVIITKEAFPNPLKAPISEAVFSLPKRSVKKVQKVAKTKKTSVVKTKKQTTDKSTKNIKSAKVFKNSKSTAAKAQSAAKINSKVTAKGKSKVNRKVSGKINSSSDAKASAKINPKVNAKIHAATKAGIKSGAKGKIGKNIPAKHLTSKQKTNTQAKTQAKIQTKAKLKPKPVSEIFQFYCVAEDCSLDGVKIKPYKHSSIGLDNWAFTLENMKHIKPGDKVTLMFPHPEEIEIKKLTESFFQNEIQKINKGHDLHEFYQKNAAYGEGKVLLEGVITWASPKSGEWFAGVEFKEESLSKRLFEAIAQLNNKILRPLQTQNPIKALQPY